MSGSSTSVVAAMVLCAGRIVSPYLPLGSVGVTAWHVVLDPVEQKDQYKYARLATAAKTVAIMSTVMLVTGLELYFFT